MQNKPAGLSNETKREKIQEISSCQQAIWKRTMTEELMISNLKELTLLVWSLTQKYFEYVIQTCSVDLGEYSYLFVLPLTVELDGRHLYEWNK